MVSKIHLVRPAELTPAELTHWAGLERADGGLDSPFFRPEHSLAVATARTDVEVALLEDGGTLAGVFPFQRGRWNLGAPVGLKLSDLHGALVRPGSRWTAEDLLRGCGLRAWLLRHLPADPAPFAAYHRAVGDAPGIDLRGGFGSWQQACRLRGSRLLSQILRKGRKLAREVGPLRFAARTAEPAVFESLLAWKAEQRRRSGTPNVLDYPWAVGVLDRIRTLATDGFAGMLSALYAGDELAAVHLGMRSRSVLHYGFPAFNRRFERYSPGLVLLVELARAAAQQRLARLDLGRGTERYKMSLMTTSLPLAEGVATGSPVTRLLHDAWSGVRRFLQASPVAPLVRGPKQTLCRTYFWSVMR